MRATRRLAAILTADVAGYSRLIGADEQGTLAQLKTLRAEVVDPAIASNYGRIVKTTGDGLLAEFGSTVDALCCAQEIQAGLSERNAGLASDNRLDFRIGIHQGDIVVEDGDIFGDGVNIAARLEAMAEPGGICVSARVQEDAIGKLDLTFHDLGEQRLHNIARPVRVYAVSSEGSAAPTPAAVVGSVAKAAAPRLSIVVLPFANLNNDPEQQYLADAITVDVTTDLSRLSGAFVISCNTAFAYRNKQTDTRQIGSDLGVRYALEGSVQRFGNKLRVTVQLIDAESDKHLWAERFDREIGDLLILQDEITSRIASTLGIELVTREAARPTKDPDALDFILRGRAAFLKPVSRDARMEQVGWFERALAIDPESVAAQAYLAIALATRVIENLTDTPDIDVARAERSASDALAASPHSVLAHHARGQVLRARRRYTEAASEFEAVLALASDRTRAVAAYALGQCKLFTGSIEETIPLTERAIRLSPHDPEIGIFYHQIGLVHLLQSRTDEAINWLEKARNATPGHPVMRTSLASGYALKGQTASAAAELAMAQKLTADDRYSSLARLIAFYDWLVPSVRALFEATYFAGLRKAGWPDE